MKRRMLSALLALVMVLSLLPMTALAEEPATSGTCGENVIWEYDSATHTLTISGTGAMEDYDMQFYDQMVVPEKLPPWFEYRHVIYKVVIGEGITHIGDGAFYDAYSMGSVTIPDSVTSIGAYSFYQCCDLASLELPDGLWEIGEWAFYHCCNVSEIVFPETVTAIGYYAFFCCLNLKQASFPDGLEIIEVGTFKDCTSLTAVELPDVDSIGDYAFQSCVNLKEVKFLGDAPDIGFEAFSYVNATAYYPADNATWTESVRSSYGGELIWVSYEPGHEHVFVPVITEPTCETDGYTTYTCECGSSYQKEFIGAVGHNYVKGTCSRCGAEDPEWVTSGVCGENMTWSFDEAAGTLTISGFGEMDSYASGTPAPWLVWSEDITTVVIENGITSIGGCAFVDCTALTSVSIPETVTHIWDGAFARCSSLYDVTIPESIVNVGNSAFEDCISLKMMTIRGSNINVGHAAFKNCSALEKVTLGAGVREIGWYTFQNCTALKQIAFEGDAPGYISADAFTGVTADAYYPEGNETWTDEYKANYGGSLTWKAACLNHSYTEGVCTACGMEDPEKIIEPDVPAAPDSCGENAVWSFDEATGTLTISGEGPMADYEGQIYLPWKDYLQQITTVVVEPGITSVGNMAFCGMFSLTKVTLPDGLTRIGDGAFSLCMALEEITLPNSLVEIGSQAFDSTAISTVTIPANVETIGHMAFAYCDQLTTVRFEGDAPVRPGGPLFSMVTATAYYPAGNSTWTEEIRQAISGVDSITWVPMEVADVLRIAGADRIATSLKLADQLKETLGVDKFGSVIVASALNFPDALTGSYLAAVKDAPILLTYDDAHAKVRAYIEANLTPGGTVYILGGESAVSADFAAGLSDFNVKRVAGSDRFGTNLEILREAGVTPEQEILICTATGFADSLSASAASLPILLVHNTLSQEQQAFLATTSGKFVIIGGEAAVSARLEAELDALGDVERVGGANRYETSVLVAKRFVPNPDAVLLAYARNYPDGLCGGPLAVSMNAALILTDNYAPGAADAYVDGISSGIVVGGTGLISDEAVISVFDLNADILIPAK